MTDEYEVAMKKAVAEVQRVNIENIIDQSTYFADNVLKRLIAHTLDVDVAALFDDCLETRGSILISDNSKSPPCNYTMGLDIVDRDYMLDLGVFNGSGQIQEQMVFLLNTVKVLFCPLKDSLKIRRGDESFNYVLQLGLSTTMFIDEKTEKRIGIVLTKVD